ncbi:anthranilate phosphoribosyltransferase [Virgibacillus sp.]|uniref:anthranilate phosphoribosyltransferase n=1 Tax=Virgibacillus sp. TaxID=1872700 RepID=UPI001855AFAF|nr:anthranilate phosphoribosyltransferase [Virgibacillus sp.]NWO14728.1 anthranilate phosphoribosyltransferase [Virgibacillus sp.]
MRNYLKKLLQGHHLNFHEMKNVTLSCINNYTTESEIAALLTALQIKGETSDEIAGLVEVIRSRSLYNTTNVKNVMDNCGTGGDISGSFNISTTSAFVIAGAGVPIAKHGNRSISSKTGSADVLETLGVSLFFTPAQVEESLDKNKIVFLFAPHVHNALKSFSKVRKDLGLPTIFNIIGPLINPVMLHSQFIGVYRKEKLEIVAQTLHKLGRKRAIVVNGANGMDEASLSGVNHLILLEDGKLKPFTLHPEEVGLPMYPNEEIQGGDAKKNAAIMKDVLQGNSSAYLDTVLLNAGLGLYAHGTASSIQQGMELANESVRSGKALACLLNLVDFSKKCTREVI